MILNTLKTLTGEGMNSNLLQPSTIDFLFESAHIQRWNEFIRPPIGLSELDKQSHKAVIAFILAGLEKDAGAQIDEQKLIEGILFEFFERTLLTDIKPPIFRRLLDSNARQLHEWSLSELSKRAPALYDVFGENMKEYLLASGQNSIEKKILRAAHYLSSRYELSIIAPQNANVYGFQETQKALEDEMEEHYSLISVQKVSMGKKAHSLIDLLGRLRFQKRWTSTPRTPETSVMGHMFITATLSFLSLKSIPSACSARVVNSFFGGLFHDLPEVLTRDIISPIKRNVEGLDELIKGIELTLIEEELLPICPYPLRDRIKYIVIDEFADKIKVNGEIKHLENADTLHNVFNDNSYEPIDGSIINACDKLSAYFEACVSVKHGIKSTHLTNAISQMLDKNKKLAILGVDYGRAYEEYARCLND